MCPESGDKNVDDHSNEDQGGGSIVELIQTPLVPYLIQVQPGCGDKIRWVVGECRAEAWSFPLPTQELGDSLALETGKTSNHWIEMCLSLLTGI